MRQIEFILNREVNINKFNFSLIHLLSIGLINTAQAMRKMKWKNKQTREWKKERKKKRGERDRETHKISCPRRFKSNVNLKQQILSAH